jgi:hypothetical protein|tara:strand:+ start:3717 stop:4166 length:450 start_codon:yes stop_codon:yes gene_type:complete
MGTGYTRTDTDNSIADEGIIYASDLDSEFDAIVAAFDNSSGHSHDGTLEEGGAVTVLGPVQEYVGTSGDFSPKSDGTYDLGKDATRWATGYLDDLKLTTSVSLTGATSPWKFTVVGNDLVIKYGATSLAKLDTDGNLTLIGSVTESGSI